jgi:hypothetical protein
MNKTPPRLFFDTDAVPDFETLVGRFEAGAFASPFRSTVPLVALAKDQWLLLQSILSECGLSRPDVELHFEFKVNSPRGAGKPSQTDAMVLAESSAIAVETKWTEPRYPTVAERLNRDGGGQPQRDFLNGWLDLLSPHAKNPLHLENFSDVVYQMMHRAASACLLSKKPSLVYLQFVTASATRAHANHYHTDLTYLHGLLGRPAAFPFYLVQLPVTPTDEFRKIESLKKGLRATDRAVRAALLSGGLFDFGDPAIHAMSGA